MIKERIVTLRANTGRVFKNMPSSVKDSTIQKMGSKWGIGADVLKGLNDLEQRAILPIILGVTPVSPDWNTRVRNYYLELSPKITAEGRKLNVATVKKKIEVLDLDGRKEIKEVDFPLVPEDYIIYKQALVDPDVARTRSEKQNHTRYPIMLDDDEEELLHQLGDHEIESECDKEYYRLIRTEGDNGEVHVHAAKINWVLRMFNINPQNLDEKRKELELKKIKNDSLKEFKEHPEIIRPKFLDVLKDDNLETKALIIQLVETGEIINEGAAYIDAKDTRLVLGSNLDEAVAFINNPANNQKKMAWQYRMTEKVK